MALRHDADAVGARHVRPGFCFAPADDLAFALGFPHFVRLATGHPDDADSLATAESILCNDSPYLRMTYPRDTARRLARALMVVHAIDRDPEEWRPTGEARIALTSPLPLTEDEARELVVGAFAAPVAPDAGSVAVLLLEAFVGPDAIVEAAIEGIERGPRDAPRLAHPARVNMRDAIMMASLRLPEAAHERAIRQLRKAFVRLGAADRAACGLEPIHGHHAKDPLIALRGHGRPVVEAAPERIVEARLAHAGPWSEVPDPRLVFLGGDEVYRAELACWSQYSSRPLEEIHPLIIERFGPIRSPLTTELMTDMAARSAAPEEARAWLEEHADDAAQGRIAPPGDRT